MHVNALNIFALPIHTTQVLLLVICPPWVPVKCNLCSPPARWGLLDVIRGCSACSSSPRPRPPPPFPCQLMITVGIAGPQRPVPDRSGHRRTSTAKQNVRKTCQIECQKICQIICKNMCQIECQIQCQKKSKMPEYMLDTMSEYMSDRRV